MSCHGSTGGGGRGTKLNDGRVIESFDDPADQVALVTVGRGAMPGFEGRLSGEEIDAVVRTGGSAQIPRFVGMLGRIFGSDKVVLSDVFSCVTVVAGTLLCPNWLDAKLFDDEGHVCIRWPLIEAIGSIQYLGKKLHIAGRD